MILINDFALISLYFLYGNYEGLYDPHPLVYRDYQKLISTIAR